MYVVWRKAGEFRGQLDRIGIDLRVRVQECPDPFCLQDRVARSACRQDGTS